MVLKKSKIKIPYIRLNFQIVRQSDERWWCAMQGTQKMKAGPSTEIEQANLSNHSNAAVVKTMVVSD